MKKGEKKKKEKRVAILLHVFLYLLVAIAPPFFYCNLFCWMFYRLEIYQEKKNVNRVLDRFVENKNDVLKTGLVVKILTW